MASSITPCHGAFHAIPLLNTIAADSLGQGREERPSVYAITLHMSDL